MRHRNHKTRLSRTSSHKKALLRNIAKSFVMHEKIVTSVAKAKEAKKVIEPLITLAKEDSLLRRRRVIQFLGLHFNALTPKQAKQAKNGDTSCYNDDRKVVQKLFQEIGPRFRERPGGYTRIVPLHRRVGDASKQCILEVVE